MFGMFGKGKGKGKAAATVTTTETPREFQVWYQDSIGRWTYASTHNVRSDANVAVRMFTTAKAEIREIY